MTLKITNGGPLGPCRRTGGARRPNIGNPWSPGRAPERVRRIIEASPAWDRAFGRLGAVAPFNDFWVSVPPAQQKALKGLNKASGQKIADATTPHVNTFIGDYHRREAMQRGLTSQIVDLVADPRILPDTTIDGIEWWLAEQPTAALVYLEAALPGDLIVSLSYLHAPFVGNAPMVPDPPEDVSDLVAVEGRLLIERITAAEVWQDNAARFQNGGAAHFLTMLEMPRNRADHDLLAELGGVAFEIGLLSLIGMATRYAEDYAHCANVLGYAVNRPQAFPHFADGRPDIGGWLDLVPLSAIFRLARCQNGDFRRLVGDYLVQYPPAITGTLRVIAASTAAPVTRRHSVTGEIYAMRSAAITDQLRGLPEPIQSRANELLEELRTEHGHAEWMRAHNTIQLRGRQGFYSVRRGLPSHYRLIYWAHPTDRVLYAYFVGTHEEYNGIVGARHSSAMRQWAFERTSAT